MAFTTELWRRIGGFPEDVLVGEDTLFDFAARRLTPPAFVRNAKALYRPGNTFYLACRQMARYAVSDGKARVRGARLFRNAARCALEVVALAGLRWSVVPLLVVLVLESRLAFHKDWPFLAPIRCKGSVRPLRLLGLRAVGRRLQSHLRAPSLPNRRPTVRTSAVKQASIPCSRFTACPTVEINQDKQRIFSPLCPNLLL